MVGGKKNFVKLDLETGERIPRLLEAAPFSPVPDFGADGKEEVLVEVFFLRPKEIFDGDFLEAATLVLAERHQFHLDRFGQSAEEFFDSLKTLGELFEHFDVDDDVAHRAMSAFGFNIEMLAELLEGIDRTLAVEAGHA